MKQKDTWKLGNKIFESRLIAPIAFQPFDKCINFITAEEAKKVILESGTQFLIVSPASTFNKKDIKEKLNVLSFKQIKEFFNSINRDYIIINNTARSKKSEQAVKRALEGYKSTRSPYIKLEVFEPKIIDEKNTLIPLGDEVMKAAIYLKDNYPSLYIMPFIGKSLSLAKKLESLGVAAIRVSAGYIGLNKGIVEQENFKRILKKIKIPIIAEGGLGKPEHAQKAMELGADAVLVNTAITTAGSPSKLAKQFRVAVEKGRANYLSSISK